MNNRTEAKLTDLSGMQKAIEEILKQAWERGRKYGQNEERPQCEWINLYPDGLIAGECSACHWQATQYEDDVVGMPYCPNCGAKMVLKEGDEE